MTQVIIGKQSILSANNRIYDINESEIKENYEIAVDFFGTGERISSKDYE